MQINKCSGWMVAALLIAMPGSAQKATRAYPIIPYPASLVTLPGQFVITSSTVIVAPRDNEFGNEAKQLNSYFINSLGTALRQSTASQKGAIVMRRDAAIKANEGYTMRVTPQQVLLSARTPAGMGLAVQTLRQLLPVSVERRGTAAKTLVLPAVAIADSPTYAWRGMHLDVSRHFFSIDYLRRFIDVMALYKMNKFHLHLTDDQGWRIEIRKYPKLTENGAWRTFNNQDSVCMKRAIDNPDFELDPKHIVQRNGQTMYGGFYTQAELKELVKYAAARHIDIVPEIDMPGHMMAAINEYPYLSCDGTSVFGKLFSTPICPCLPSTFTFAQDVYREVMDIFPSEYIHIGGDEVDRSLWAKSEECKRLMAEKGLKSTAELQSYFIDSMEQFFKAHGRKMVGWDEVLEGGVSNTATIMYWRMWVPKAPVQAAKQGNPVVMTPGNPLYFDGVPDKNSIPNVYNFSVVPAGLTEAEGRNIIGAQANIWTEYIPNERRADYMYMPRMTALSEVLWTNRKDYPSYLRRLQQQYARLDQLNVNYRLPDLSGFVSNNVFVKRDTLNIKSPLPGVTIRYTTDSTLPGSNAKLLDKALIIDKNQLVRLASFRKNGSRGDIYDVHYQQQSLAEPVQVSSTKPGLVCHQFKGAFTSSLSLPASKPDDSFFVDNITVPKAAEAPEFGLQYRGYLDIPADGIYNFYLTADDGAVLTIANRQVVNNDGLHAPVEKSGQVALKKGLQPFALDFIEGGGGYTLKLKYAAKGSEPANVPNYWFKHE